MKSSICISMLLLLGLSGCSNNLKEREAEKLIDSYLAKNGNAKIFWSLTKYAHGKNWTYESESHSNCISELERTGFLKATGKTKRYYNYSTIKPIPTRIDNSEEVKRFNFDIHMITGLDLYMPHRNSDVTIRQVEGEKKALVNFEFHYRPTVDGIPDVCRTSTKGGHAHSENRKARASLSLTTDGWMVDYWTDRIF